MRIEVASSLVRTSYSCPLTENTTCQPGVITWAQISAAPPNPRQESDHSVCSTCWSFTSSTVTPSWSASQRWASRAAAGGSSSAGVVSVGGVAVAAGVQAAKTRTKTTGSKKARLRKNLILSLLYRYGSAAGDQAQDQGKQGRAEDTPDKGESFSTNGDRE